MVMRDSRGRFVKGHKPIGSTDAMIQHNRVNGNWNTGLTKYDDERIMNTSRLTSKRMKGKKLSLETRKKISISNTGKIVSNKTKDKLRVANTGKKLSKITREKISNANKGRKATMETRLKMSKAHSGVNNPFFGKRHSKETRGVMSENKIGIPSWNKGIGHPKIRGKNHPNWKGGVTPVNEKIRKSIEYKNWRSSVFKRDKYTCVKCGQIGGRLEADHIKPFCSFPKLRFILSNGRTLCFDCHKKTNTYGGKIKKKIVVE